MFDYVDSYIEEVKRVDAVIKALSPTTRTMLDETGADMDGVLGAGPPPSNNPRYWVAAASYWAYMFSKAANESSTVIQVGASQLMDAPGQEPSVTLLDWSSGNGTARFWVVRLFVEAFAAGDLIASTTAASSGGDGIGTSAVHAMGFAALDGGKRSILLINKRNAWATVSTSCGASACSCSTYRVIDEFNGLLPAREEACDASGVVTIAPYATAILSIAS